MVTATLFGAVLLASYLAGSVPFGWFIARLVAGVDIRQAGSGNIGATNVGRVVGRKWGLLVFVLDALKGLLPTLLLPRTVPSAIVGAGAAHLGVCCGLGAILGHIFPVWFRFRGGKGGATGLGVGSVLAPHAMLGGLAAWIVVVLITRFVSVGTMLAGVVAAVVHFGRVEQPFDARHWSLSLFMLFAVALIIARHRSNIGRVFHGTERKLQLGKKKINLD